MEESVHLKGGKDAACESCSSFHVTVPLFLLTVPEFTSLSLESVEKFLPARVRNTLASSKKESSFIQKSDSSEWPHDYRGILFIYFNVLVSF